MQPPKHVGGGHGGPARAGPLACSGEIDILACASAFICARSFNSSRAPRAGPSLANPVKQAERGVSGMWASGLSHRVIIMQLPAARHAVAPLHVCAEPHV